ncbi:hypothetical protein HU200_003545 [Digitaria exilis]|uniref:Stress-response A/B barrel domain-containing protein n=1 Tax=Digitaria exilis TaxID=1010633 RepID=A0A835FUV5_9POAL|nr:hypothetical protein HU200_003545 [Digitaria exilis]
MMVCHKALSSPHHHHLPTLRRRLHRSSGGGSALRIPSAAAAMSSSAAAVTTRSSTSCSSRSVPEAADSGAAAAMVSALQALSAQVPGLAHIHAGPVLRLGSPAAAALGPTHVLHSRYATEDDLHAYAAHPAHVAAVGPTWRPTRSTPPPSTGSTQRRRRPHWRPAPSCG